MRIGFVLYRLIHFYEMLIFIECILSWIPMSGVVYDIRSAIRRLTDPFVDIFRRLIPSAAGGMGVDFTPMIAVFVLDIVKRFVIYL